MPRLDPVTTATRPLKFGCKGLFMSCILLSNQAVPVDSVTILRPLWSRLGGSKC